MLRQEPHTLGGRCILRATTLQHRIALGRRTQAGSTKHKNPNILCTKSADVRGNDTHFVAELRNNRFPCELVLKTAPPLGVSSRPVHPPRLVRHLPPVCGLTVQELVHIRPTDFYDADEKGSCYKHDPGCCCCGPAVSEHPWRV